MSGTDILAKNNLGGATIRHVPYDMPMYDPGTKIEWPIDSEKPAIITEDIIIGFSLECIPMITDSGEVYITQVMYYTQGGHEVFEDDIVDWEEPNVVVED
jgi:hypothetical protein